MLRINQRIRIPDDEIELRAVHSSGPGGQNVNKVASAIHLRFDVVASSLPASCKRKLMACADRRVSAKGIVVIKAQRFREQERNREDALERLASLIRKALHRPAPRKTTRPSAASRRRRLEQKRQRGQIKTLRSPVRRDD